MAAIGDLTLSDLAGRARRYRPVLVTVVVVLAALRVLPERDHATPEASASPAAQVTGGAVAGASTTSTVPPAPTTAPTTTAPVVPRGDVDESSAPGPSPTSPPVPRDPDPAPVVVATGAPPTTAAPEPRLVATAWASASAGTPLADTGVPDGSLPVGTRVGERDKVSFLRHDVAPSSIRLVVDPDGSRGIEDPLIQACRVTTTGWEPGQALDYDDAPQWDPDACVDGHADGDSWTFAVGSLDAVNGVALVPAPDAPLDFQVAFRTSGS